MRSRAAAILALSLAALLAGCVTVHGPRTLTLSGDELERSIETDLGSLMEVARGLDARRPEVAFMPVAGRVELAWTLSMPAESGSLFGTPVGVVVVASGRPQLNAKHNGIDLTDVTVDDVRVLGLPQALSFGFGRLTDRRNSRLADLPLYQFTPRQLRVGDVVYGATAIEVTYDGLRVAIEPR